MDGDIVKKQREEYLRQKSVSLPSTKRYGIDLDGVCFDFLGGYSNWLRVEKGFDIKPEMMSNYWLSGISEEIQKKVWGDYFHEFCKSGGILSLQTLPGAANGLKLLKDMGNEICFITAREKYVEADTIEAITTKLGLPNPSLYIIDGKKKSPYIRALNVQVFIDDSPSTLADCVANTSASVYCMDQVYNQHMDDLFMTRVRNWQEFLEAEGWMQNVRSKANQS